MSDFKKNVLTLASSSFITLVFPILISPLNSRIYSSVQYGEFGILMSYFVITSVFINSHFIHTINLQIKHIDIFKSTVLSLIIGYIVVLIVILIFLVFMCIFSINTLFLSLIFLLFLAVHQSVLISFFNKNKNYKIINRSRILFGLSTSLSQLILGYFLIDKYTFNYLIIGIEIGYFLSSFYLVLSFFNFHLRLIKIIKLLDLKKHFACNFKTALLIFPNDLLYVLTSELPIQIISHFYSFSLVGQYSFSNKLLKLTPNMIGKPFQEVFRQEVIEKKVEVKFMKSFFDEVLLKLVLIGIAPLIIVFLFGEDIFVYVFGAEWSMAGKISSVLIFMYFFKTIAFPLSYTIIAYNKLKLQIIFNILIILITSLVLFLGSIYYDIYRALLFYSVIYSIIYLFYIWYSRKIIKSE